MPHHYPRPTLSTCGPVILEGLCGARDDRCSICFIFFPYLLDSFSIFVSCFFILFWYAFHMFYISFIYIYFHFFPTGELFTVGAAPQKNLHVFYGQYIFLLKWPEAYVIICVCNKQWRKMTPTCNSFSGSKTSISMILTKNSIWFYSFHFFRETKTYLFFFNCLNPNGPLRRHFEGSRVCGQFCWDFKNHQDKYGPKLLLGRHEPHWGERTMVDWVMQMMSSLCDDGWSARFFKPHNGYSSFSIVLLILRGTCSVFVFWPFKSLSLHFLFHDCFSMLNSHPFVSEFHATYWFRSSQDPRPSRIARMPCGRCLSNKLFLGPKLFHLG